MYSKNLHIFSFDLEYITRVYNVGSKAIEIIESSNLIQMFYSNYVSPFSIGYFSFILDERDNSKFDMKHDYNLIMSLSSSRNTTDRRFGRYFGISKDKDKPAIYLSEKRNHQTKYMVTEFVL